MVGDRLGTCLASSNPAESITQNAKAPPTVLPKMLQSAHRLALDSVGSAHGSNVFNFSSTRKVDKTPLDRRTPAFHHPRWLHAMKAIVHAWLAQAWANRAPQNVGESQAVECYGLPSFIQLSELTIAAHFPIEKNSFLHSSQRTFTKRVAGGYAVSGGCGRGWLRAHAPRVVADRENQIANNFPRIFFVFIGLRRRVYDQGESPRARAHHSRRVRS